MAVTRSAKSTQLSDHARIWFSLKSAIASSSGFNSWKGELPLAEAEAANIVEETTILRSSKKVVAGMRQLWLSCYGNNFSHQ